MLPRFVRHLSDCNHWTVSAAPRADAEANYLLAYFEAQKIGKFNSTPLIAYMTHLEAGDNAKATLYKQVAQRAALRICMNAQQKPALQAYGPTVQIPLPLELERFTLADRQHTTPIIGVSGYTYASGRKGEALVGRLAQDITAAQWTASGRGWPIPTKKYTWAQMPAFYQSLDIFVCTSEIEGGPMTTLEALATGCPVVIPAEVGLHPELPDIEGIFRYPVGDYAALRTAVLQAIDYVKSAKVNRGALREATSPHSVSAWTEGNRRAIGDLLHASAPVAAGKLTAANHGVYMVAFGEPSRECAKIAIRTIHKNMPGVKVALVSDKKLGVEDIFIQQPDSDIGGRIAKLRAYELAPAAWEYVLYLDADIEVRADVRFYFQLVADGWEYVICKDGHLHDTMKAFERRNNQPEYLETISELGTENALQINGGAWAFRRTPRVKRFFDLWLSEWRKYEGRDQGALIRALYTEPMRVFWLGNEWNTLITLKGEEYPPGIAGSAGVLHFVGRARRWRGQVPQGKGLTDPEAWAMVDDFMAKRDKKQAQHD